VEVDGETKAIAMAVDGETVVVEAGEVEVDGTKSQERARRARVTAVGMLFGLVAGHRTLGTGTIPTVKGGERLRVLGADPR
jgi:hypothetical protein